jgi:hypothetical protein
MCYPWIAGGRYQLSVRGLPSLSADETRKILAAIAPGDPSTWTPVTEARPASAQLPAA